MVDMGQADRTLRQCLSHDDGVFTRFRERLLRLIAEGEL